MRMRMGGYQGPGSVLTHGMRSFAEALGTDGGVPFAVDMTEDVTASGVTARSLFDGIESGAFEAGYMASGYLTARVPDLGVLDLPFAVARREAAYAALDGSAGDMLRSSVEGQTGYRLLGFWDNGFRHLTNRARAIRSPADCTGLVVRTLDNRIYTEVMAAMGFTPVVTDVRDLRAAIETGRVDAQENPLTNTVGFDIQHHHGHATLTGHFFGLVLFVCNAAWFDALPADARARIVAAADTATAAQRAAALAQEATALAAMKDAGVAVVAADDLDRAAFLAACEPVLARERARLPVELLTAYLSGALA